MLHVCVWTLFIGLVPILISCQLNAFKRDTFSHTKELKINSKAICANEIGMQYERISCSFNNKMEIINSGIYNGSIRLNATLASCLPIDQTTPLLKTITQSLKLECSKYSCLISMETIRRLWSEPLLNDRLNDLILDINYSCQTQDDSTGHNSQPRAYSFTYFFYIITLVLSTSCILVGAIFILRKFLVMRRRNILMAERSRHNNQGYTPTLPHNNNAIWTTTAPPSYENIYESSLPINPLPDYDSSLTKLTKDQNIAKQPTADSYSVSFSNEGEVASITNTSHRSAGSSSVSSEQKTNDKIQM